MKYKIIVLSLLLSMVAPFAYSDELTIAAAANVKPALEEIQAVFEKETNIKLTVILGSSGKLTTQIENGAPFDIFMSADMKYPDALHKGNLTINEPKIYAYGLLILWTLRSIDLSKGMEILSDAQIQKIAIADPKTAPYGREAVNALKRSGLYANVYKKLVYGESIAQTNQFINLQAADIGFTAKSTVFDPALKEKGQWKEVPPDLYDPIAQGVVILAHAKKNNLAVAQEFYDFLFSETAKNIFLHYGYFIDK